MADRDRAALSEVFGGNGAIGTPDPVDGLWILLKSVPRKFDGGDVVPAGSEILGEVKNGTKLCDTGEGCKCGPIR